MSLDQHTFIAGLTSSGKSYAGKAVFKASQRKCVVLNLQAEDWPGAKEFRKAPTFKEFWRAGKVAWTEDFQSMSRQMDDWVSKLFAVGEALAPPEVNRANPWCNVFVDEAHLLAPNGTFTALDRIATQGLRFGVVLVTITQRPQNVSKTILSQSPHVVLFKITQADREYLEAKLFPITDDEMAHLQRKYHFLVLDPAAHDGWRRCSPL